MDKTRTKRGVFVFGICGVTALILAIKFGWTSHSHTSAVTPTQAMFLMPSVGATDRSASLESYRQGINPHLFGEPVPDKPEQTSKPASTPSTAPAPIAASVEPPDPFANYVYTGFIRGGMKNFALIEDRKTREGWFVEVGDTLGGGIVGDISGNEVAVKPPTAGKPDRRLTMNSRYSLVPLDKGAIGDEAPWQIAEAELVRYEVADVTAAQLDLLVVKQLDTAPHISEEEAQHLQNEVFEGRMTAEEAAKHGLGSGPVGVLDTIFGDINVNGEVVTSKLRRSVPVKGGNRRLEKPVPRTLYCGSNEEFNTTA